MGLKENKSHLSLGMLNPRCAVERRPGLARKRNTEPAPTPAQGGCPRLGRDGALASNSDLNWRDTRSAPRSRTSTNPRAPLP